MTNQTIEQAVEEFGNQFDELKMKPPKDSMTGLERELLKDFMRKALQAQRDATLQEVLSMKRVAHQEKEVMYAPVSVVLGEVVPVQPVHNVRPLEYVKVFDIKKLTNINPTH